jgi:hypothetical protein
VKVSRNTAFFLSLAGLLISTIAGHRWLTSTIPATQEAEIRRIMVQGQPGQIVLEAPSQKYPTQKDWQSGLSGTALA